MKHLILGLRLATDSADYNSLFGEDGEEFYREERSGDDLVCWRRRAYYTLTFQSLMVSTPVRSKR